MNKYLLSDLLEIKNGKDYKHLQNGSIPVYGSGGLMTKVNQFLYNKPSILLPRKGTLNNIQYVDKAFWTVDTLYYTVVNTKLADTYYLFNYLKRLDLSNLNSGTGVPSMTFGAYYNIPIQLPELSIQQKIASVLSALDDKIELNNKINAELEVMAKTLYDYWFVQFEFPNENGKPYKTSGGKMMYNEVLKRDIPEGWEVKRLEEVVTTIIDYRGKTPKKLDSNWSSNKEDIIALSAKHIKKGKLINIDSANRVDDELYQAWMKQELKEGDVLMTSEAPCGEFFYLLGKTRYCLSQRVFAIRPNPEIIHHSYLYYELSNGNGYSQILGKVSGSTVFGIRQDELRTVNVLIPNTTLQNNFGLQINNFYGKIRNNEYQNQELTQLRDWLLPMLMNGQVKVMENEEDTEDFSDSIYNLSASIQGTRRKALAVTIINNSLTDKSFGRTKFEKLMHLCEYHILKEENHLSYYANTAGPYDGGFTNVFWNEVENDKWYKFNQLGKLSQIIKGDNHSNSLALKEEIQEDLSIKVKQLISLFSTDNYEFPEIISTLYAVWNNRLINNQLINDELLKKDFLDWDESKKKYQDRLDNSLNWMRTHSIVPDGWGKEIKKAKNRMKKK